MKARTHYEVRLVGKGRKRIHVHADYFKIECGVLTFRNSRTGDYPETVMVIAPGMWLAIENLSIPKED